VVRFLMNRCNYESGSQPVLYDLIYQEKYLTKLLEKLEKEPDKVIGGLNSLKEAITSPDRMIMHVFCDSEKLHNLGVEPTEAFAGFLPDRFSTKNKRYRAKIHSGSEPSYLKASDTFGDGVISGVGSCESCYMLQTTPCQLRYEDEDLPALKLLLQYLAQTEGPLWREIRGRGLAYGVGISFKVDTGVLEFYLYRTSDPLVAYEETKRIVEEHLAEGEDNFDEDDFEAAKRSLIFEIVEKEETMKGASVQSLLNYYRGVPSDYNRRLSQRIWKVEMDELRKVGQKYLKNLFSFDVSNSAISCHPSKLDDIVAGFGGLGRDFRVIDLEADDLID